MLYWKRIDDHHDVGV